MARVFRASGAVVASTLCMAAGAVAAQAAEATADLNIRSGPGTMYSVRTTVPAGGMVDVADCSGGWCRVAWQGATGWASDNYLAGMGRTVVATRTVVTAPVVATPVVAAPVVATRPVAAEVLADPEPGTIAAPVRRTVVTRVPRTVVTTGPTAMPVADPYYGGYSYGGPRTYGMGWSGRTYNAGWVGTRSYSGGHDPYWSWDGRDPLYVTGFDRRWPDSGRYAYADPTLAPAVVIRRERIVRVRDGGTRRIRRIRRDNSNEELRLRRALDQREARIDRQERRIATLQREIRDDNRMARVRYERDDDLRRMARVRYQRDDDLRRMARTRRDLDEDRGYATISRDDDGMRINRRTRGDLRTSRRLRMQDDDEATGAIAPTFRRASMRNGNGTLRRSRSRSLNGNGNLTEEQMLLRSRRRGD